ncbi:MAG TPA: T9SS type A sorting domain-containing protein [Bacteroidia bacterium]|jgi:hypothetical protein|nr:T9SS type A sorting domain-containing protein [Bacteroidia bacterium]
MKHKNNLCALLLMGAGLTSLHAQQAVLAGGTDAAGSGGTVSYSVGQVAYLTAQSGTGSAAAGVQQSYEMYVITGVGENKASAMNISAYPNPATDYLMLNIPDYADSDLFYELSDVTGRVVEKRKIRYPESRIDMSCLQEATYFLKVTGGSKDLKSFKIIKSH